MASGEIQIDNTISGAAVVTLRGEHEAYSAPKLDRALAALIFEGLSVVVDMSETEFVDSSVMSVLLRAREDAYARGLKFALVLDDTTGWAVKRLFEVTGLETVFCVGSTPQEALAAAS